MMSSSSSKLAYLSKYTSDVVVDDDKKKKKKKKRKKEHKKRREENFVVKHDDDEGMPPLPAEDEEEEEEEEGPTVVMDSTTVIKQEEGEEPGRVRRQRYDSDDEPRQGTKRRRRYDSDDEQEEPSASRPRRRYDSDDNNEQASMSRVKRRYDSDDDEPRTTRRRHDSDDDQDVKPRRRRYDSEDDSAQDTKPRRRYDSDDDDEKPRRGRRHDSDSSSDGKAKPQRRRYDSDSDDNDHDDTRDKMSSGHSAGLQQAHRFSKAERKIQQQKLQEAQDMVDRHGMGETIYRDSTSGQKVDASQVQGKKNIPQLSEQEQANLNKGRVQKQQDEAQMREWQAVQQSSFSRFENDASLEDSRRDVIREGDPMAMHAAKKRAASSSGRPQRPVYKGPAPKPNRYGIRPGYRWDGVDRGNGFEDKVLASKYFTNHKKEQAYRWSSADM